MDRFVSTPSLRGFNFTFGAGRVVVEGRQRRRPVAGRGGLDRCFLANQGAGGGLLRCLFGFGEARGANRVTDSLKRALKSPLVNQGQLLQNARNLLVHIAGGETLSLFEVEQLMKEEIEASAFEGEARIVIFQK